MSKSSPDNLRALAQKFGLEIVWISSEPGETDGAHYMIVIIPRKAEDKDAYLPTKAAVFQWIDGSFTSNNEIPGVPMTKLLEKHSVKKFLIET